MANINDSMNKLWFGHVYEYKVLTGEISNGNS